MDMGKADEGTPAQSTNSTIYSSVLFYCELCYSDLWAFTKPTKVNIQAVLIAERWCYSLIPKNQSFIHKGYFNHYYIKSLYINGDIVPWYDQK